MTKTKIPPRRQIGSAKDPISHDAAFAELRRGLRVAAIAADATQTPTRIAITIDITPHGNGVVSMRIRGSATTGQGGETIQ